MVKPERRMRLVNNVISTECYREELAKLNPPSANGSAIVFRDTFAEIINFIKASNPQARILLSALLPRKWDHERRNLIRISYNNILKKWQMVQKLFSLKLISLSLIAKGISKAIFSPMMAFTFLMQAQQF